jgi:hypothetical protein
VRFGRGEGIGIEPDGTARCFRDSAQVLAIVDAQQLFASGGARGDHVDPPRPPPIGDHVHRLGALRPLGMPRGRLMLGESVGVDNDQRHRRGIVAYD